MAGIAEASAIITVAQVGIGLSQTIIAFVSDVRDAPKTIVRIGNEIKTTSGRLKEIAGLIEENTTNRLLSDEGVGDVARCSYECDLILAQVGNLLIKGGWRKNETAFDKDDIDISLFSALKWPFLKSRLETPRAELQIIKADLNLLFTAAMARKSSNPLLSDYAQRIPALAKTREWAARKAEIARQRARERCRDEPDEPSADPEIYKRFAAFEQQKAQEQEDRRALERAALLRVEQDNKKKEDEDTRKEIERSAVEEYKRQQQLLKEQTTAREEQFRKQLAELNLDAEQVDAVLAIPSLNLGETPFDAAALSNINLQDAASSTPTERGPRAKSRSRLNIGGIFGLNWSKSSHGSVRQLDSDSSNSMNSPVKISAKTNDQVDIEFWLVDILSRHYTELAPSGRWMNRKLKKFDDSWNVWHRFAQLQPMWRIGIQEFLNSKNRGQTSQDFWKLIHVGLPRRSAKLSLLGHDRRAHLIRVIISRQSNTQPDAKAPLLSRRASNDPARSELHLVRPATTLQGTGEQSATKSPVKHHGLPEESVSRSRVSFADESGAKDPPSIVDSDHATTQLTLQGKSDREGETIDRSCEVIVRIGVGPGGLPTRKGVTFIPQKLVSQLAITELGYPFEGSFSEKAGKSDKVDTTSYTKVPRILSLKEVNELAGLTKSQIDRGQVPWLPQPPFEFRRIYQMHSSSRGFEGDEHSPVVIIGKRRPHSRMLSRELSERFPTGWVASDEESEISLGSKNSNRVVEYDPEVTERSPSYERRRPPKNNFEEIDVRARDRESARFESNIYGDDRWWERGRSKPMSAQNFTYSGEKGFTIIPPHPNAYLPLDSYGSSQRHTWDDRVHKRANTCSSRNRDTYYNPPTSYHRGAVERNCISPPAHFARGRSVFAKHLSRNQNHRPDTNNFRRPTHSHSYDSIEEVKRDFSMPLRRLSPPLHKPPAFRPRTKGKSYSYIRGVSPSPEARINCQDDSSERDEAPIEPNIEDPALIAKTLQRYTTFKVEEPASTVGSTPGPIISSAVEESPSSTSRVSEDDKRRR